MGKEESTMVVMERYSGNVKSLFIRIFNYVCELLHQSLQFENKIFKTMKPVF